jgi:hypothetical protein
MRDVKAMKDGVKSAVLVEILRALYDLPRGALDEAIEAAIELHDNDVQHPEYWADVAELVDTAYTEIGSCGPFGSGRFTDV